MGFWGRALYELRLFGDGVNGGHGEVQRDRETEREPKRERETEMIKPSIFLD